MLLAITLAAGSALRAQDITSSLIADQKAAYNNVKNNLLKTAEKMPEDAYSFKPTPEVQTFAQRIAHIANQVRTCSSVTGHAKQPDAASKTAKADLVAALKESFEACDAAWDSLNDKTAAETITFRGGQRTKLSALISNTTHDVEMYGYLCVYMRLKGVVPPSSDRT
jgi:hypothetical protein